MESTYAAALDGETGEDFTLNAKEALEVLLAVINNDYNCCYLFAKGAVSKFSGILRGVMSDNNCLDLALQILNQLFKMAIIFSRERNKEIVDLMKKISFKELREVLNEIKEQTSNRITGLVDTCLLKMEEIQRGTVVKRQCLLKDLAKEFLSSLNLSK